MLYLESRKLCCQYRRERKYSENFEIKTFQIWGGSGDFSVSAWLRQESEKAQ